VLQLIAEALGQAQRLTARGRDAFDEDETLRLAAEAIVSRLGEAVKRLSEEFRSQHPDVPWRDIAGSRDIVVHEYHRIDYDTVWEALTTDMPQLAAELRDHRQALPPQQPPPAVGAAPGAAASPTRCGYALPRAKANCIRARGHEGPHRSR
jgi:uncharacterized protein with HEPN domain